VDCVSLSFFSKGDVGKVKGKRGGTILSKFWREIEEGQNDVRTFVDVFS